VRLLLDAHICKAAVLALRKRCPEIDVAHLADWRGGAFLRSSDEEILTACYEEERTFVTFDLRTVPDLLRYWAAEGHPHSGVIFGDDKTVKPNSPNALSGALASLVTECGAAEMINVVRFLQSDV
jgi:hypothetical protein